MQSSSSVQKPESKASGSVDDSKDPELRDTQDGCVARRETLPSLLEPYLTKAFWLGRALFNDLRSRPWRTHIKALLVIAQFVYIGWSSSYPEIYSGFGIQLLLQLTFEPEFHLLVTLGIPQFIIELLDHYIDRRIAHRALFHMLWVQTALFFMLLYLVPEVPTDNPPPGYKRIMWKCGCGKLMFNDVKELKPGAASKLEKRLWMSNPNTGSPLIHSPVSQPPKAYTFGSRQGESNPVLNNSQVDATEESSRTGSTHNTTLATAKGNVSVPSKLRYLLLCINTRKARSLEQIDISSVYTDEELFTLIRATYTSVRRPHSWHLPLVRWLSSRNVFAKLHLDRWTLYIPKSVNYVKFRLIPIKLNIIPTILQSPSLPPESEVRITKNYIYDPYPQYLEDPLLHNQFMHELLTPGPHLDGYWTEAFPKKLREKLLYSSGEKCVGWGIMIDEGLNWIFIWAAVLALLLLTGVVVGVYAVVAGDVSGAAGLGAYLVAVITVCVTPKYFRWQQDGA